MASPKIEIAKYIKAGVHNSFKRFGKPIVYIYNRKKQITNNYCINGCGET
jgi:hypothetical protein